jgi:protein-L-isoaspartate(D-aspartate) O-methyltransferase
VTDRPGARLARALSARGAFTDPGWHRAVPAVGRAAFVPDTVWVSSRNRPGWYRPVTRDDPDYAAWVDEDWALMTQLDDGHPVGEDGWGRLPTSSISQPSLAVTMLHALHVEDGMRVLEIGTGTGTGYNTTLLCARLGSENVTSIEVDPEVAARAAATLADAGYKPHLIVGDGTATMDAGPFDRVLATVGVARIPVAWVAALSHGGCLVAPWAPGPRVRPRCTGAA